jgi:hypothetical protein
MIINGVSTAQNDISGTFNAIPGSTNKDYAEYENTRKIVNEARM